MPKSFYALITPIASPGRPEHPIELPPEGAEPPSIWEPVFPTPPIVIIPPSEPGKPPVVIWPSPGHPEHPIYNPPGIWPPPGRPAHPIALPPMVWPEPPGGGPPVIIWPGDPAHPIVLPPISDAHPEHPIVIPLPPQIWPSPGRPAHPIVIPPEEGEVPPDEEKPKLFTWVVGWSAEMGWVLAGVPNFPAPAPSAGGRRRAK